MRHLAQAKRNHQRVDGREYFQRLAETDKGRLREWAEGLADGSLHYEITGVDVAATMWVDIRDDAGTVVGQATVEGPMPVFLDDIGFEDLDGPQVDNVTPVDEKDRVDA